MNDKEPVVLDLECFRHGKSSWIVKELAVAGKYVDSITFKPPHPFTYLPSDTAKAYVWLTDNLHGLFWDSGDLPYNQLFRFVESIKLRFPFSDYQFYAKGSEKCQFLAELFDREVNNLEDFDCPTIPVDGSSRYWICESYPCRASHFDGKHCARNKAGYFANWIREERRYESIAANIAIIRQQCSAE